MKNESRARANVILSMFIYGSIGLFVRYIPLPSSVTAMARGLIGAPFLLLILAIKKQRPDIGAIKSNLRPLLFSGTLLGFNWILLFEAYRHTTVATATLCYYMAPMMIVALSPLLFKERLSGRKIACILAALLGMVFVSGVAEGGLPGAKELKGVLLGLAAAVLYASIVISNKGFKNIDPYDRTIMQLGLSAVWMLLYNLISGSFGDCGSLDGLGLIMLLTVGIVHTGLAYLLYFGAVEHLKSQTLAILSYIDPVVAVLLSALVLRESVGMGVLVGAALILGAALVCELPEKLSD